MTLTFDKIKDLIGINGTVGVDLLGSARVRDNLFVSGYLTVGGKKFTGLNINGVKAIDKDVKWKGEYIEIEKGGTGQDLSSATGAIQVSSGTLTAGTLEIDKGGTGDIVETGWKNSYVTTNADGTLNYDGTDATAPELTSIPGTLTSAKGGTGQDLSSSTGIITVSSGTVAADATPAVNLTDATNVPLDQIKSGTTLVKSGVSTSGTWVTGDIPNLAASKITSGTLAKTRGGFGADASTVSVALITDNIESAGLKAGRNLGDGLEGIVIFSGASEAGTGASDTPTSIIWTTSGTSAVVKVAFNYFHEDENLALRFVSNIRSSNVSGTAKAVLSVYAMNDGGTAAAAPTGSVLASGEIAGAATTFRTVVSSKIDITGLTEAIVYRVELSLENSGAYDSYLTGLTIATIGSA